LYVENTHESGICFGDGLDIAAHEERKPVGSTNRAGLFVP
jgi:hypothetical protein